MTIQDAEVYPFQARLERAYVSATARHETRDGFVLRLETEDGHVGLGEAAPLSNRTENLEDARTALEDTVDELVSTVEPLDELIEDPSLASKALQRAPTARFATQLALLDARSRQAGRPLAGYLASEHLHGRRPPSSVPVNATIPATEPDETQAQARAFVDEGFETVKLKATGSWAEDLARVEAARRGAPDVNLRLDVNGSWRDLDEARQRVHTLAQHDLEYLEQPMPAHAVLDQARLVEASPIEIAADEPVLGVDSARELVERGAADVLVLKPMVLGGPLAAIGVARMAEEHDVPVVVTSTIDGAIGRAGALHTAAALGILDHACGLATGSLIADEPARFDEQIDEGNMRVPPEPGHGAELTRQLEAIE